MKNKTLTKEKNLFIIIVSAFLGAVLLFGIITGGILIARSAGAVLGYRSSYLKEGEVRYLAAAYKSAYLKELARSGVAVNDDPGFWSMTDPVSNKTYGELYLEGCDAYIKSVLIGSYLFDRNANLSRDDREAIKAHIDEVIEYRADGSRDKFNELVNECGFKLSDYEGAMEMVYKFEKACEVIFGVDGYSLESGGAETELNEYLSEYSHTKLMFIRTNDRYITDPNTGETVLDEYNEKEKEEIRDRIAEIRQLIKNYEEDNDHEAGQMNPDLFTDLIKLEENYDEKNADGGYYFHTDSAYTAQFIKDGAGDVVKAALEMRTGEYREVEVDIGVCFIYKYDVEYGAYARASYSHFFTDFYSNAAEHIFDMELKELSSMVDERAAYLEIDLLDIPRCDF